MIFFSGSIKNTIKIRFNTQEFENDISEIILEPNRKTTTIKENMYLQLRK